MRKLTLLILLTLCTAGTAAPAADGARAYIISPRDGATVQSPVTVVFGLQNMGVAPASQLRVVVSQAPFTLPFQTSVLVSCAL